MVERKLPFVFSVPHCSNRIPPEIRGSLALSDEEIDESTDAGTLELFGSLPASAVCRSSWSRLVVDLNRSPDQRDRKGIVPHVDYGGRKVYHSDALPDAKEIERRVRLYYEPFHRALRRANGDPEVVALFDCHSLNGIGPPEAPDPGEVRKDIVLSNNGDRNALARPGFGSATCGPEQMAWIKETFEQARFSVSLNRPYAGGFITTHYGGHLSSRGKWAVQVEINQALYCRRGMLRPDASMLGGVLDRLMHVFWKLAADVRRMA